MVKFLACLLFMPLIVVGCNRVVSEIQYNRNCGGHLKRAADANSLKLADQELSISLKYLEDNGMTHGYTSIVYTTPDEDVGFWYTNLKTSLEDVRRAKSNPKVTQLEESNVLMKLRETLLDHKGSGESVTQPVGIEIYPANKVYLSGFICCSALCVIGIVLFAASSKTY